nr:RagB/SusD family nutrient uptake outer membrane protein [uncultured Marinifilum sp.]
MKNIIYLLILTVFATSCDDWMDIEPKGKVIPSKAEDYRLLLDNTNNYSGASITETADLDLWVDDDIDLRDDFIGASYPEYATKAYKFEDHFYLESEEDASMNTVYSVIYLANTVINEVLDAAGDEDEKMQLQAEAKIHRAFSYLKLINIYAKQYDSSTASSDLGVPMRLEAVIEGSLARGTVQEAYDLILNDINEAYDYLPDTPEQLWRPSKASASALLARTYLIMGDFTNALKYADISLGFHSYLDDYNTFPPHSWYPGLLSTGKRYLNQEQTLLKKPTSDYHLTYPSQEFMDLFDQVNDLRFTGKLDYEWSAPGTRLYYYYYGSTGAAYGLTVPEMLLTRAECNARAGNASDAMDDVNLLRQHRIATAAYADLTAADAAEALIIVKEERRRELAFMGIRYSDIRRYNAYDNANISIVHTIDGENFTLAPGDNKWALPFARKYILKNSEIEQNPR